MVQHYTPSNTLRGGRTGVLVGLKSEPLADQRHNGILKL